MAEVLDALGWPRAFLVGHSMGVAVAIEAVLAGEGQRVIGLDGLTFMHMYPRQPADRRDATLMPYRDDFPGAVHGLCRRAAAPDTDPALTAEIAARMAEMDPDAGVRMLGALLDWDMDAALGRADALGLHITALAAGAMLAPEVVQAYGQALLECGQVVPDALADLEVGPVGPAAEPAGPEHQGRDEDEDAERELPAEQEDRGQRAGEEQHVLHQGGEAHLHELLHGVDVGGHPGDEATGLLALEEVETEAGEVVEDPDPQVAQELLADPGHHDDGEAPEDEGQERDEHVEQHRPVQGAAVAHPDAPVDPAPDEEGPGEQAAGLDREDGDGPGDRAAVGTEHGPEAAQDLLRLLAVEGLEDVL